MPTCLAKAGLGQAMRVAALTPQVHSHAWAWSGGHRGTAETRPWCCRGEGLPTHRETDSGDWGPGPRNSIPRLGGKKEAPASPKKPTTISEVEGEGPEFGALLSAVGPPMRPGRSVSTI